MNDTGLVCHYIFPLSIRNLFGLSVKGFLQSKAFVPSLVISLKSFCSLSHFFLQSLCSISLFFLQSLCSISHYFRQKIMQSPKRSGHRRAVYMYGLMVFVQTHSKTFLLKRVKAAWSTVWSIVISASTDRIRPWAAVSLSLAVPRP